MIGSSRRRGRPVHVLLVILAMFTIAPAARAQAPIRASTIAQTMLDGSEGIRRALASAIAAGTDTIVVPLPLYPEAGPDRFAELLERAHDQHLRVFAAIDVDRVALADEVPASRDHVIYRHPEWLMIPRMLAPELFDVELDSPEYFGRLARWTRSHGVDGVYISPVTDEAVEYVAGVAEAALRRYAVDGVQLEGARYPADDFDYGRSALDAFRAEVRPSLEAAERLQVDEDGTIDPFAYPNAFPERWREFRLRRQTRLVASVRETIRRARPDVPVAVVVTGAEATDRERHFQDWRAWLDRGLVDAIAVRSNSIFTIVADAGQVARLTEASSAGGSR